MKLINTVLPDCLILYSHAFILFQVVLLISLYEIQMLSPFFKDAFVIARTLFKEAMKLDNISL